MDALLTFLLPYLSGPLPRVFLVKTEGQLCELFVTSALTNDETLSGAGNICLRDRTLQRVIKPVDYRFSGRSLLHWLLLLVHRHTHS